MDKDNNIADQQASKAQVQGHIDESEQRMH